MSHRSERAATTQSRRRLLMENLEQRQLLAASVLDTDIPYLTGYFTSEDARDQYVASIGDQLEQLRDNRSDRFNGRPNGPGGWGDGSDDGSPRAVNEGSGANGSEDTAQPLTLGSGPGDDGAITLSGSYLLPTDGNGFTLNADEDYYEMNLRGGDILSARITGGTNLALHDGNDLYRNDGDLLMYSLQDQGQLSFGSPLFFGGDANLSYVIPEDGTYYLSTSGVSGLYTVDLRVFRPVLEQGNVGETQTLFLDFDGELLNPDPIGLSPVGTYLEGLYEFMPDFGLNYSDTDRMIDLIIENVVDKFEQVGIHATNGWYEASGNPGEYGIQILNSRDHGDMWGQENVARVIVGGDDADTAGLPIYGIAQHVDVGNFNTEDTAIVFAGVFPDGVDGLPATGSVSPLEIASWALGNVVAHEAGHLFGLWHTVVTPFTTDVIATTYPDDLATDAGDGPDGIIGTDDDIFPQFLENRLDVTAAAVDGGYQSSRDWLAWVLASGTQGGVITGSVFNDANRSGSQNAGEGPVEGVTVFIDANLDGVRQANETSATTDASGSYSLIVAPGDWDVMVDTPSGYAETTANPVSVSVALNGSASASFGLSRVQADATGFKWADVNGNGIFDQGEPGVEGVYIYLDLDGDNRIDLGEPRAITGEDGSYQMNFPGPGTYTIREVVAPGWAQTFPASGEHIVTFDGTLLQDNYNFGNQPVQDYGDAPSPYPTLAADNGAVHGILAGLTLGSLVDTEADGQPTSGANGDDTNGLADEDGISFRAPLSPGEPLAMDIDVTNATGATAYVNAWIDLNQDGDWADSGEQFLTNIAVTGTQTLSLDSAPFNMSLPTTTPLGQTMLRVRLSQSPGVGVTGFAAGGEVEDYQVTIAESPDLANGDQYDVPRGALSFPLDVLSNDFDLATDPLEIISVNTTGTLGQVVIAQDGRSLFYTPRSNTLGPDAFEYTVRNASGTQTGTARVDLNVIFQSEVPIAVDDSFDVPQGSSNQPINVLANDIPSIAGGLRIIATSAPDQGGSVSITAGGQSLRYTPAAGFAGTEQFTYTVSDSLGQISSAVATIHLQPGAQDDDIASFIVETFAADGVTPINTIPAGQPFKVRVSVDDLRSLTMLQDPGLGSAYLDLLYTDGLVATVPGAAGSGFAFDVEFGPLFSTVLTGDAATPGILNEIGGTQSGLGTPFSGEAELFTVSMLAVNPGIAEFVADPADATLSDVVLLNPTDTELTPSEIRFGRRQLTIVPSGSDFTFAVDDSYPNQIDSAGNPIVAGSGAILDVLNNDNFGPTGEVEIVNIGAASSGVPVLNDNGTPLNPLDDYIVYTPGANFNGVDQFSYTILSADGIQSTAQVTVTVGDAAADDLVDFQLSILDENGTPVSELTVGQSFQLQIMVDDLRDPLFGEPRGVFAAYMDLLFDSTLAEPLDTTDNRLGFDVVFGQNFDPDTAVGDAFVPGLINEFGTFQTTSQGSGDPLQSDPVLLARIDMIAKAPGLLSVIADPADVSPFQDTLLFQPPDVVPISQIRYDIADVVITSGGEGESPYQNARNRWDVNDDNSVSPIDALLVLNRLNRGGEGEAGGSGGTDVYWDVNGDSKMSPIDALQVINYLNRGRLNGEGEGAAVLSPLGGAAALAGPTSGAEFAVAVDSVFSDLGESMDDDTAGPVGGDASHRSSEPVCTPVIGGVSDTDSDDDEERDEQFDWVDGDLS